MHFGKKGENDARKGSNGWEPHRDKPICSHVPYIVCSTRWGLKNTFQKIVKRNSQIVHGPLWELDKSMISRPDLDPFPDVTFARDLQAQGACALRFFSLRRTCENDSNFQSSNSIPMFILVLMGRPDHEWAYDMPCFINKFKIEENL